MDKEIKQASVIKGSQKVQILVFIAIKSLCVKCGIIQVLKYNKKMGAQLSASCRDNYSPASRLFLLFLVNIEFQLPSLPALAPDAPHFQRVRLINVS